jgi:hypothetical protein
MLSLAFTHLHACEQGFCHFAATRFAEVLAPCPSSPSTESTEVVKLQRFSRHAQRCFPFFSFSCDSSAVNEVHLQQDFSSASVTQTFRMQLVPTVQNPQINESPLSSSAVAASLSTLWLVVLLGKVLTLSLARGPWMRGSLRAAEGRDEGSAGQINQLISDFIS